MFENFMGDPDEPEGEHKLYNMDDDHDLKAFKDPLNTLGMDLRIGLGLGSSSTTTTSVLEDDDHDPDDNVDANDEDYLDKAVTEMNANSNTANNAGEKSTLETRIFKIFEDARKRNNTPIQLQTTPPSPSNSVSTSSANNEEKKSNNFNSYYSRSNALQTFPTASSATTYYPTSGDRGMHIFENPNSGQKVFILETTVNVPAELKKIN